MPRAHSVPLEVTSRPCRADRRCAGDVRAAAHYSRVFADGTVTELVRYSRGSPSHSGPRAIVRPSVEGPPQADRPYPARARWL